MGKNIMYGLLAGIVAMLLSFIVYQFDETYGTWGIILSTIFFFVYMLVQWGIAAKNEMGDQ